MKTTILAAALSALVAAAPPTARVEMFTGRDAAALLHQCSRAAPSAGEGWYSPSPAQVDTLERAVAAHAPAGGAMAPQDHVTFHGVADLRARYAVQVAGVIRRGRRYVYGNFTPLRMAGQRRGVPTVVCDGGIAFFGAEVDAATGAVTSFDVNGNA